MSNFLDRVTGQSKAITHLKKNISSNRIPHAFLFTGPRGTGKYFTAIQFINEIYVNSGYINFNEQRISNLEEPFIKFITALPRSKNESGDDAPLAKLDSSVIEIINNELSIKKRNPYYEINIDKAQNIKISSIRDVKKNLAMDYDEIPKRFVLIHEAQNMSIDSQNALLKSLEEPPENVIFILHSSNPNMLLPTIISRCHEVQFQALDRESLIRILKQYFNYNDNEIELASFFADGMVTKAVKLIEQGIEEFLDKCINILRYSLARRYNTALKYFEEITEQMGDEGFHSVLDILQKWFIDTLKERLMIENEYFDKYNDTIKKFNDRYKQYDINKIILKIDYLKNLKNQNINLNVCISNVILEIGYIGIG
ncbi:MAG: AAA family ATPase [Melioribacteraceae bacterium]|nr:AAA family ATPase [Melioribacteraceae bacterium]